MHPFTRALVLFQRVGLASLTFGSFFTWTIVPSRPVTFTLNSSCSFTHSVSFYILLRRRLRLTPTLVSPFPSLPFPFSLPLSLRPFVSYAPFRPSLRLLTSALDTHQSPCALNAHSVPLLTCGRVTLVAPFLLPTLLPPARLAFLSRPCWLANPPASSSYSPLAHPCSCSPFLSRSPSAHSRRKRLLGANLQKDGGDVRDDAGPFDFDGLFGGRY